MRAPATLLLLFAAACDDAPATDAAVNDDAGATPFDAGARDAGGPRDAGAPRDAGPGLPPPTGCPDPGAPVAEPYRWYPALDLARVPFHVADGPWGARMPITAPEPPRTTRSVTVTSASELEREGLVPGSEITVGASIDATVTLLGDVTDLDLIVPPGITLRNINVGRASPPSTSRRVRIRGTTPGMHSGGTLGTVTFFSQMEDAILDGVDLNSADGARNGLAYYLETIDGARFAIVNVRAHAMASVALQGDVVDLVVAGCSFVSGAGSREANGFPEGWGLRAGRRLVIFDNRIEGNRYHRVRVHPGDQPGEYAWLSDNVFVDPYEARIASAFDLPASTTPWDGFWAVCNTIYAHSDPSAGCIGHSFEAPSAAYSRLTNNRHFGENDEAGQRARLPASGDHDWITGNTYAPWEDPPPWRAPGDPRAIPLPAPAVPDPQDPACPGP